MANVDMFDAHNRLNFPTEDANRLDAAGSSRSVQGRSRGKGRSRCRDQTPGVGSAAHRGERCRTRGDNGANEHDPPEWDGRGSNPQHQGAHRIANSDSADSKEDYRNKKLPRLDIERGFGGVTHRHACYRPGGG